MFKQLFNGPRLVIFILAVALSGWLVTTVDGGLGGGWTFNVIRNWQENGFGQLHGRLVANPGGHDVVSRPDVYAGHRAASLYPAFVCAQLLPWPGNPLILYFVLCAIAVLVSTWVLLGRSPLAFTIAALIVVCPGYISWQTSLDPKLVCALAGFPFCAMVIAQLSRPRVSAWGFLGLFFLLGIYSTLNWTTALVLAMLFATLLVMRQVSWRHLAIYTVFAGTALLAVVTASVASKMGHGSEPVAASATHSALTELLRSYTWGNAGYGLDLSTKTALTRLIVVNTVGFFPVLLLLGWQAWRQRNGLRRSAFRFALPFCAAAGEILFMRNYFAHHPWMSCHFLLLGGVLSLCAWRNARSTEAAPTGEAAVGVIRGDFLKRGLAVLAAGVYGFVIITLVHQNNTSEFALVRFVRSETPRPATIVIDANRDPALMSMANRLPELLDRQVTVVTNFTGGQLSSGSYLLTGSQAPAAGRLGAANTNSFDHGSLIQSMLKWYGQHISHRRAGDKMNVADSYFLYERD
jgi:hypothetical protein